MDWKFIVTTVVAIAGIATSTLLAIRLARRKKPVWAYITSQIIGIGTDAPPELKLTFNDKPVLSVFRTLLIIFNRGNGVINKEDVTRPIMVNFSGATILREPNVKPSNDEIGFSAKRVTNHQNDTIELDYSYLDHKDGAVIELLHTKCNDIKITGNVKEAGEPRYIGKFINHRPIQLIGKTLMGIFITVMPISVVLIALFSEPVRGVVEYLAFSIFLAFWLVFIVIIFLRNYSYLKFPKWILVREDIVHNGVPVEVYCAHCRAKKIMKNPRQKILKNGRPAIQGNCPICDSKLFRIGTF